MHIPTHILSGWCVGNFFPLTPRERLGCMIAATAADLDGFGFFFSDEMYWRFHHVVGHSALASVVCAAALWPLIGTERQRPLRTAAVLLLFVSLFHLHLAMDLLGSGPLWPIEYLWPFSRREYFTPYGWPLMSWQNYLIAAGLLMWTVLIAVYQRRTPLEVVARRLDAGLMPRAAG